MSVMDSFNGNFTELADLMNLSWAENPQGALLYTESFLRSALQQSGTSLKLCPAVYEDGELVAFGANFPRRVQAGGQVWNLLLDSFITVAPSHKGKGLGSAIWRGLAESGKRHGADGLITMCVEGDHMNRLLPTIAERSGLPTVQAFTIQYMGRPVPKDRAGSLYKADPDLLMRGALAINEGVEFGRVWTQPEAEWQCLGREGAFGCSLGSGTISAYMQLTAGASPTMCGLVDDIVWGELDAIERKELAGMLMESAATAGVDLLLAPVMNYVDMKALAEVGFRKTRRTLQMYVTSWNPQFEVRALSGAYIDVF